MYDRIKIREKESEIMNKRSWKERISESIDRIDEAVAQGLLSQEQAVLVKQRAESSAGIWEVSEYTTDSKYRRSD